MRKKDAFTLIELLTVIAVIAILAAISFGITSGVYQRQARTKASAELSALAAALESYRAQYGTYPITEEPNKLLRALANRLVWQRDEDGNIQEVNDPVGSDPRPFIEPTKFDVSGSGDFWADGQTLVDPWGNEYYYRYSPGSGWNRFGFLLLSKGPDGKPNSMGSITEDGIIAEDESSAENADNIYVGGQ